MKQHDITDCGASCLATISKSKQYGCKTSITKIREVAGTDKQGTNAYGVIKAAKKLGFTAEGVRETKKHFIANFRYLVIPQETFPFSGSIMDNFNLGMDDVVIEQIYDECKKAQAHDFINEFPLSYETRLEENGTNLSGGQRQRLAIARAILKQPDI